MRNIFKPLLFILIMEPLKPEQIKELLTHGSQAELDEYERLLAERFHDDSSEKCTPEQDARDKRLKELYATFYPVEAILTQRPLYAGLLKLPAFRNVPAEEAYVIGPKTNYTPDKESRTAIGVSPDAVEIYLKDVKIDAEQVKLNGCSSYDFKLTQLSRDASGIKLEGKLERTYDFGLGQEGRDYSGSTISGYVDRIERQKDLPKPKLPDFEF